MPDAAPRALGLLLLSLSTLAFQFLFQYADAIAAPLPLTPHETVRTFVQGQRGDALLRKHLDLHPHVIYNPLIHFTRDDVPERFTHSQYGTRSLSDVAVLREFGYYLPGIDDEEMLTSGRVAQMHSIHTTERQTAVPKVVLRGTQSVFEVSYYGNPPPEARAAFEYALRIWANTFPCKTVQLRVKFVWKSTEGSRTLAAAVSPFSVLKRGLDNSALRPDAAYTPTMAAAVGNRDFERGSYHIEITFNAAQPWHYSTKRPAGISSFDFATVAAHEICHGLFFTGALLAKSEIQQAKFQSMENTPGRFDQFIQMSNGVGIARSCDPREMYRALTTNGLMFRTTVSDNTFALYAPGVYRPGSSTYHLDSVGLTNDCKRHNIPEPDCSNLMTFELDPGYTQHTIGLPTLRIMRSVLGDSRGLVKSNCNIPPAIKRPEREPKLGVLDATADIGPFKVKVWVIIAGGCIAAVGVSMVIFFIASAFARRR